MATLATTDKRTSYCGNLRREDIGTRQCVMGWVARVRDLGSLIFIDLRDRTGIVQLAFDETTDKAVFEAARSTRAEYVIVAHGNVRKRSSINETIPTGYIEIEVDEYKILSEAQTTPFEINENADNVRDELKLKYRYLDLRRQSLQQNILVRHNIAKVTRDYFYENDFIEIET
ncbi:MAG: Asp-tRNA(Asn)/Glu-tRNA(Gln) amidotransferase GatCAB subunit C, partial [Clostridia bacterium]|nr:Asp-tRNA(Asn)/Glu-tRNA(Gln) amidotransferase GatCAB subunit C [Clostridia bacterium]